MKIGSNYVDSALDFDTSNQSKLLGTRFEHHFTDKNTGFLLIIKMSNQKNNNVFNEDTFLIR